MKVLLIGGGGREHALAWKLSQSPLLDRLYCAPGNAGIEELADCVTLDVMDHEAVIGFCRENDIGLVVIGPEAPLVAGLADDLAAARIKVFGPSREAAKLEGSKGFTKDLCAEHGIPTAAYRRFADARAAKAFAATQNLPIVVKADGLAAGKGVAIAATHEEADAAIDAGLSAAFGAGAEIVIEEFLDGEEASFFALVDGETALPLATAQDHKRAYDGDQGPNTGGMGAYSPAPVMTPELSAQTMERIIMPTVRAMQARGTPFKGVLYAGLMIEDGTAKLIEYNVRFGDPEAQVLMLLLKSDLLPALLAVAEERLGGIALEWHDDAALCVVMAAKGYPGAFARGSEIKGLAAAGADPNVEIFHAGTKQEDGIIFADGGRVLGVTARGRDIRDAQVRAYRAIDKIVWPEGFYRRDIGRRAIAREAAEIEQKFMRVPLTIALEPFPLLRECFSHYAVWFQKNVTSDYESYDLIDALVKGENERLAMCEDLLSKARGILGASESEFTRMFGFKSDLLVRDPEKIHDVLAEPLIIVDLDKSGFSEIKKLPSTSKEAGKTAPNADFTAFRSGSKFAIEIKTIRMEANPKPVPGIPLGNSAVPQWWLEMLRGNARMKIHDKGFRVLKQLDATARRFGCDKKMLILYTRRLGPSTLTTPHGYRDVLKELAKAYPQLDSVAFKNYYGEIFFHPDLSDH